jgi:hypothetical protein
MFNILLSTRINFLFRMQEEKNSNWRQIIEVQTWICNIKIKQNSIVYLTVGVAQTV